MTTFVRVKLEYDPVGGEDRSPVDNFFEFDLKIDDQRRVVGKWDVFGQCIEDGQWYPFVMRRNGDIEFNYGDGETETYSSNLRDLIIRIGEPVRVWSGEQRGGSPWPYVIKKITVLGEREFS